jgi:NAD(P)-dependent dehydrogenase (short-subunit alcohol dehydrogenase family)
MDILRSQLKTLPYPEADCIGKTVIITGANIGLGKEAARHFVRLNAKVILAVRSIAKGEEAKKDIESTTNKNGSAEVWELDLANYSSVKAFGERVSSLPRVDIVIMNASIASYAFETAEDNESTITVNVISTFLLVVMLLPLMRTFAITFGMIPVITIVSSDMHHHTKFPEKSAPNTLAALNDKQSNMQERYSLSRRLLALTSRNKTNSGFCHSYATSKLLQLLAFQEISSELADQKPMVVLNMVNPGLCKTALTRSTTGALKLQVDVAKSLIARTAEVGSRTLVHGGTSGTDSYGRYMSDCNVNK